MSEFVGTQQQIMSRFFLVWCVSVLGNVIGLLGYAGNLNSIQLAMFASILLMVPTSVALGVELMRQQSPFTIPGYILPWLGLLSWTVWVWWKDSQVKTSEGAGQLAVGLGVIMLFGGSFGLLALLRATKSGYQTSD